jgi:hypothetical protein
LSPLSNYLKTAENAEFAENLFLIYTFLSGLCVLCGVRLRRMS